MPLTKKPVSCRYDMNTTIENFELSANEMIVGYRYVENEKKKLNFQLMIAQRVVLNKLL